MKKGYFYGTPDGNENLVLDILSNTKVNSYKTSSIPFTEFWLSKNRKVNTEVIHKIDSDIDLESADKCFEFPVYATNEDGRNIGRPSMTDLMIITEKYNIAIEGKFTENLYETIKEWKAEASENSEKLNVLNSWYRYIEGYCDIDEKDIEKIEENVVYQFLHRTASACYGCKKNNKIPVVIYQLFYDSKDPKSKKHQEEVKFCLEKFASLLKFNNRIKFLIELTPITNFNEVKESYSWAKADLFSPMKTKTVYKFN